MSKQVLKSVHEQVVEKFPSVTEEMLQFGLDYLKQYNYINGVEPTPEIIKKAARDFQERFGIEVDGEIGPRTLRAMTYPRCGCADVERLVEDITKPNKWGYKHLKLYIADYIPGLTKDEMEGIIKDVFAKTSKVIDLTFELTKKSSEANFVVRVSGNPKEELGSPSGVLAFQYLPPKYNYTGPALEGVFDSAETWVGDRGGRGIRFRNVFTHEVIGHGLGLTHSKVKTALMAPFYDPDVPFLVSPDDVERLVALYGAAKDAPPKPTPTPTPTPAPTPVDPKIETITLKISGTNLKIETPDSNIRIIKL